VAATLQHEEGNRYRLELRGRLTVRDWSAVEAQAAAAIERTGPIRLLIALEGFDGWDARDNWSDLGFYVRHGDAIERIAIVGDDVWRSEALMFAGADLRKGAVVFFEPSESGRVQAWLASA
jgi:SpoIIAA-like